MTTDPARVKHVRINSKFRTAGTTSNFVATFSNPELRQVTSLALLSFSMNRGYTNVQSFNNVLYFRQVNGGAALRGSVPPAQYDDITLVAALNQIFPSLLFEIQSNGNYMSLKITARPLANATIVVELDLAQSTIAPLLGLSEVFKIDTENHRISFTSRQPFALDGPGLYVQAAVCDGSTAESLGNQGTFSIPLLQNIVSSYEFAFGNHIVYEPKFPLTHHFATSRSLQTVEIMLTDQYGNQHDLPANCYCDAILAVTYV